MAKKLAIDWDESELRLVAAQCSGRTVKVTDAAVVPVEGGHVVETLRAVIGRRGLQDTETLVAIGRGKAELRELQLPPVPDEELPEMVRFQAIRSFATAGDSATVDFLVTNRSEQGIEMIAAAVAPKNLTQIRETCESADLATKRIALRPLAAAALYLVNRATSTSNDTVLIDLLADDAEIVVAREGHVIFVRTVRMPSGDAARGRALAGELRRSLVACGSSGSLDRVILWGRESVHTDDVKMLAEASGSRVEVLDPFELVDVDRGAEIPDHVGRLAPLVGLLAADEQEPGRLIDFLNPRQRPEETHSPYRKALYVGLPIAAVLLLAFTVYRQLTGLDQQIADLQAANASMKPEIDQALEHIRRTEKIDAYLDGDVNWLRELRRLATSMPPSDQLIVRSISATTDRRDGGGTLTVKGAVTSHDVIDSFEESLRDDSHIVAGAGVSEQSGDAYRLGFTESITISAAAVRETRYAALTAPPPAKAPPMESLPEASSPDVAASEALAPDDVPPPGDVPPGDVPPDDVPPDDVPPGDEPQVDSASPPAAPDDSPPPDDPSPSTPQQAGPSTEPSDPGAAAVEDAQPSQDGQPAAEVSSEVQP